MGAMRTTRDDPSTALVACEHEGCQRMIAVGDSYSFVVVTFATTGPAHVASVQCPAEQHFACCSEHAAAVAHRCIDEHLIPAHRTAVAALTAP